MNTMELTRKLHMKMLSKENEQRERKTFIILSIDRILHKNASIAFGTMCNNVISSFLMETLIKLAKNALNYNTISRI